MTFPRPIFARINTPNGALYINPAQIVAIAPNPQNPLGCVMLGPGGVAVAVDGLTPASAAEALAAAAAGSSAPPPPPPPTLRLN